MEHKQNMYVPTGTILVIIRNVHYTQLQRIQHEIGSHQLAKPRYRNRNTIPYNPRYWYQIRKAEINTTVSCKQYLAPMQQLLKASFVKA